MVAAAFSPHPAAGSAAQVQPANGRTLVNFDTNFYTETQPFDRTMTLLGQQVDLHIVPSQFGWRFGDGESMTTDRARGAVPAPRRHPQLPEQGRGGAERGHDVHRDVPGQRRPVAGRARARHDRGAPVDLQVLTATPDARGVRTRLGSPRAAVEHVHRGRQPRRAADARGRVREGRPGLHRPALQHRQRLRLPRRLPRQGGREPARGVGRDDAAAARGGPGAARRARARSSSASTTTRRRTCGCSWTRCSARPNFLAQVVVNLNPKGRQLGRGFATSHEYLLVYAKDARATAARREQRRRRRWRATSRSRTRTGRRYRHLPLRNTNKKFNPVTAPHAPLPGVRRPGERRGADRRRSRAAIEIEPVFGDGKPAVWRWSRPLIDERGRRPGLPAGQGRGTASGSTSSRGTGCTATPDRREAAARSCARSGWPRRSARPTPRWPSSRRSSGTSSSRPSRPAWSGGSSATMPDDVLVLDFFAGSGTTGHAVALANAEDGGTRRCISVNSAEPTREGSNARNAGLLTVADITRARLRAVAERDRRRARASARR